MKKKSDLRFLHDKEKFIEFSFSIFSNYFDNNKDKFISFFENIPNDIKKNDFLRVSSTYKLFVKDGNFIVPEYSSQIEYINNTYKFISLTALIESIYNSDYIDFFDWLVKNEKYVITCKTQLTEIYEEYSHYYGSTKKIIHFFNNLDDISKKYISSKIKCYKKSGSINSQKYELRIDQIAKELYALRSKFIHEAKIIVPISENSTIVPMSKEKLYVFNLSLDDLQYIFEKGVLIHFGYEAGNSPKSLMDFVVDQNNKD